MKVAFQIYTVFMRRQIPSPPREGNVKSIVQFSMLGDATTSKFESKQKGGFGAGSH